MAAQQCAEKAAKFGVKEVGSSRQRPGQRSRKCDHRLAGRRHDHQEDRGCDAAAAQRLPAAEKAPRITTSPSAVDSPIATAAKTVPPRRDSVLRSSLVLEESRETYGSHHWTRLPALSSRRPQAVPQRHSLRYAEMRHRAPRHGAGHASVSPRQADRLRAALARKAKGQTLLRRARAAVPRLFQPRPSARKATPATR